MEASFTHQWISEMRRWTESLFPNCELSFPVPNLGNPYSGTLSLTAFWYRVSPGPAPQLLYIGVPDGRITALYPEPQTIRVGFAPWVTIDRAVLLQKIAGCQIQVDPFFDDRFFRSLPESGRLGIMASQSKSQNPSRALSQLFHLYDQCLNQYLGGAPTTPKTRPAFYQSFVQLTPPGLFLYYRRINMAFWDWVEAGIAPTSPAKQEEVVGLA